MKTKLTILALISALNINAQENSTTSGNVDITYGTDYYFRGAEIGQESIQATVGAHADLGTFKVCGKVFTNQTTASGSGNTDQVTLGIGKSFVDGLIDLYAGAQNTDQDTVGSELDFFIGAKLDNVLSPTVTIYRNSDDNLYTYEGSASYTCETQLADLTLSGDVGLTDVTSSDTRTYYGGALTLSKEVGSLKPHVGLALVDGDDISQDTIVSAGLTFQF